jgi:hypothetical protein
MKPATRQVTIAYIGCAFSRKNKGKNKRKRKQTDKIISKF